MFCRRQEHATISDLGYCCRFVAYSIEKAFWQAALVPGALIGVSNVPLHQGNALSTLILRLFAIIP